MPRLLGMCWTRVRMGCGWRRQRRMGLGAGVVGCVRYLLKCGEDIERVAVPIVLLGSSYYAIQGGVNACFTWGIFGCTAVAPIAISAGFAGAPAYNYAKELWRDRQSLFNFSDCTADFFFCGEKE